MKKKSNLKITKILGKGNFGTTFLATNNQKQLALKKIKCHDTRSKEIANAEASLMLTFNSKYIVAIQEIFTVNKNLYIGMNYCNSGTVQDLIKSNRIKEFGKIRIIQDVTLAITYLHSMDVCHRDIKPNNLLVHDNNVLLADFGLSRKLEGKYGYYINGTGFLETKPPEVFKNGKWTKKK